MHKSVSAKGERQAIGGFLPQFGEFAWLAYRQLLHNSLEWVRVADPEAQQLDDILYATKTTVFAYQVKWTIAGAAISLSAFSQLLPLLVRSWQGLRTKYQPEHKQVLAHLLTNKRLTSNDRITHQKAVIGSTAAFFVEAWQPLQNRQLVPAKWQPILTRLAQASKVSWAEFEEFAAHFMFVPAYQPKDFSVVRAGYNQLDGDLDDFRSYLLESVGHPDRLVQLTRSHLISALGWQARFETTFTHELFVDKARYQPIRGTIAQLEAKLAAHSGGYLFLTGTPGAGKSTLLTQWADERRTRFLLERIIRYFAFDFNNPEKNYHARGDSTAFFFDLVFQIKTEGIYPRDVLPYPNLAFLRGVFYEQLRLLGEDFARDGRRTILLIDGLDHVPREYTKAAHSLLDELPLPATLPDGVYIVLGSQSFELTDISEEIQASWRDEERAVTIEPLNRREVLSFIEAADLHPALTSEQQRLILHKSQGHPLYLAYLLERIRKAADRDKALVGFGRIDGNIEVYYRKIWKAIKPKPKLVYLLGLLAHITGSINLDFVREWPVKKALLQTLVDKTKVLFYIVGDGWTFFHNSFRQFLIQQTTLDPLTGRPDTTVEAAFHRQLATYYEVSKAEPDWLALGHWFRAGDFAQFQRLATPAHFGNQLLRFRPVADIRRDIRLGLEVAGQTQDVVALTRYVLIYAELESRLRMVDPSNFVDDLIQLGQPARARQYLREGRTLRESDAFSLYAARVFYDTGDHPEAAMLLSLAEPAMVQEKAIIIENGHDEDVTERTLARWVEVAVHFQELPRLLTRLNNIKVLDETGLRRSAAEWTVNLRLSLLQELATRLVNVRYWEQLEVVLAEFRPPHERQMQYFFEVLQAAITQCLADGDQPRAAHYLAMLLAEFSIDRLRGASRIYVADLLYQVNEDPASFSQWLTGVPSFLLTGRDLDAWDKTLAEFWPFILLQKLRWLSGQGVSTLVAVPAAPSGSDEEPVVNFQRRLALLAELWAEGLAGQRIATKGLYQRLRPLVQAFYGLVHHRQRYAYRLLILRGAYFDFLVQIVAVHGSHALVELQKLVDQEVADCPQWWPATVQRSLLMALLEHSYDPVVVSQRLEGLEKTMLDGQDVDARVRECQAQAQSWAAAGNPARAEHWLRQALQQSIGVGYRKDFQLNTWLSWLRQVNQQQPAQAPERLSWFLGQLPFVRDTTEGGTLWEAAASVLEATFAWNLASGLRQLKWQLQHGLLDFKDGLVMFLLAYLDQAATAQEYADGVHFYSTIVLWHDQEERYRLLRRLLEKGYTLLGASLFDTHLPFLLDSIMCRALSETRRGLLKEAEDFVTTKGHEITDYYPAFALPAATSQDDNASPSNVLTVQPEYQKINEVEVLARVSSYDDLLDLLAQEDRANSWFDWSPVLHQLAPALTAEQLSTIADRLQNDHYRGLGYSTLSKLAKQLGNHALGLQLAERAVAASSPTSWMKGHGKGSRLHAFQIMQQFEPVQGRERAFATFTQDLIESGYPNLYIESLDEILPVLRADFSLEVIWDEVFSYVQRLLGNSAPAPNLPDLQASPATLGQALVELLTYMADSPMAAVSQPARQQLAELVEQGHVEAVQHLHSLSTGSEPKAELFLEVLLRVPTRVAATYAEFTPVLTTLAVARNYQLRQAARQLLKAMGAPLPAIAAKPLPATYRLQFAEPGPSTLKGKDVSHLVRPYEDALAQLANQASLRPAALYHRASIIMAELDDPARWTDEYQQTLGIQLRSTRLKYKLTWPRVATARRALLHVVTELLDAGVVPLAAETVPELLLPDYQAYAFSQVPKPACVQSLQREYYGHLAKEWVSQVADAEQLRVTSLPVYRPSWLVIGEATYLHSLDWNAATEEYQCQLTAEKESDEELISLNLVFNCPTDVYHDLQPRTGALIIGRAQVNIFTRQSAWLAFNPALAKALGWQPSPDKLFGWQNQDGELLVESVYWISGNVAMPPPHTKSEAGEGWLVVASAKALSQLRRFEPVLHVEKRLTRSRSYDQDIEEGTTTERYMYPADEVPIR
ncbi:ATP-binding protein [Hymenobacter norwichensis]|uniref:ATP-binding protein n=1 Tax=Hymenobacter norwichensis TaxID=223903 RepID=UPI0003B3F135|nr:ATP-binding protein [Hymenobacter norwichensis]